MAAAGEAPAVPREREAEVEAGPGAEQEEQDQGATNGKTTRWTFLSLSQISALSEENIEGVQKKLEEFLNFKQLKTSLKESILLDYYTSGFWWAKEMNFSLEQLTGFMGLLNFLLENLSDKHMTLGDNIKELGRTMAGIGGAHSEENGDLLFFSVEQAKAVIDYLNISLFQSYKLYEYLFHSPREECVISKEYVVELPPAADGTFPVPLEEGVPCVPSVPSDASCSSTAAEMEAKESDQESGLEEPSPEAQSTADALTGFTVEDVKSVMDEITNEIIGNLEAEINKKLQIQEEAYTSRIEKLKRPI
ncbi:ciliary-associated calcium-binding coiled-coil protein 1 [Eudromia elegans]